MFQPYKIALIILSSYLFVVTFMYANLIATPLSLIALLLLLNTGNSHLHRKLGDSKIAGFVTILLIVVILHQNFMMA